MQVGPHFRQGIEKGSCPGLFRDAKGSGRVLEWPRQEIDILLVDLHLVLEEVRFEGSQPQIVAGPLDLFDR